MDIVYQHPLKRNSYTILRQAGYIPIHDRTSGKDSFVFKIRGDRYPRFHLYVEQETPNAVKWHVHLDHKEHGWSHKRHDADYDGPDVQEEVGRLKRWLTHHTAKEDSSKQGPPKDPGAGKNTATGLLARLFG